MMNAQAVKLFAKKKETKKTRDTTEKAFKKADAEWSKVKEITEIYEGQALIVNGLHISSPSNGRCMSAVIGEQRYEEDPDSRVEIYVHYDCWYIKQYGGKSHGFYYSSATKSKEVRAKINKRMRDYVAHGKEWNDD